MRKMEKVKVIGAGLAGVEAANYLANRGIKVELFDILRVEKREDCSVMVVGGIFCET